ncbi:BGTF surface domain-containing protein [Natranaeroarchaeum aerophilus]|uniref:PGF-CTERM sorting domain-containing protein n=1 Tax=Natranaeroarchaeum aerophilus TaxID=2917711 RepID=A0AAE3FRE5_9EURY|nr:BGTF surface domain-containing protein [Natranaeroarchaeum aerophilus]MCL9813468.1 PGF-CTERM sorting domain-containing protein [Natranaeroarchaeum aerophilus]
MTNDTKSYREAGRAVFLAAIMVLSMVAMTATLPGAVVATSDADAEITSDNSFIGADGVQHTVSWTAQSDDELAGDSLNELTVDYDDGLTVASGVTESDLSLTIGEGPDETVLNDEGDFSLTSDDNTLTINVDSDPGVSADDSIDLQVSAIANPDATGDVGTVDVTADATVAGVDNIIEADPYPIESVTLGGEVTEDDGSTAIDGADVSFDEEGTLTDTTGTDGLYSIEVSDLGPITADAADVTANADGFQSSTEIVNVEGQDDTQNFELVEEPESDIDVTVDNPNPQDSNTQATYDVTFDIVSTDGGEAAQYILADFGDESVAFDEVNINDVSVDGDNYEVDDLYTASGDGEATAEGDLTASELLIELGSGEDIEFGTDVTDEDSVDINIQDVTNPDVSTPTFTLSLHEDGGDLGGTAQVSPFADGQDGYEVADPVYTGELTFNNQNLAADGTVTVADVSSDQESVVVVTYEDDGELIIAGLASADNLDSEAVPVSIEDDGGFPGEHTAHLIANDGLSGEYGIGDAVSAETAGEVIDDDLATVREAGGDISVAFGQLGQTDIWQGQTVEVFDVRQDNDGSGPVQLREGLTGDDDSERIDTLRASDGVVTFDTDDLSGYYYLQEGTQTADENQDQFFVDEQEIDFEFEDDAVPFDGDDAEDTQVDLVIEEDNRGDLVDVVVSGELDEEALDEDTLEDIVNNYSETDDDETVIIEDFDAAGETFDFDDQDVGDYDFTLEVDDTTASDSAEIEVTEPVDADVRFTAGDFTSELGDNAEFSFVAENYDQDNVFVTVGDAEEVNWENVLEISGLNDIDEDDEVTVGYNTASDPDDEGSWYIVGDNSDDVDVAIADDLEAAGGTIDEAPLAATDYELSIGDDWSVLEDDDDNVIGAEVDNEFDTSFLTLTDRTPIGEDLTTWTAPSDNDADDLFDAAEDDELLDILSQTDTVAEEDKIVTSLEATGTTSFLPDTEYLDSTDIEGGDLNFDSDINLEVEAQDERPNVDAQTWSFDDGELNVYTLSNDGEQAIILLESDNGDFETDAGYDVTFTIGEDNPFIEDEDAEETAEGEFDYDERDIEWDESASEVPTVANADVMGTTNVAPGTEVDTRARAPGVFVDRTTVEVEDDGTFTATYDFSEESSGTEFTLRATDANDGDNQHELDSTLVDPDEDDFELSVDFGQDTYEVDQGDSVDIDVSAVAGADGLDDDEVTLFLNDDEVDSATVTADAGNSDDVTFTLDTNEEDFPEGDHDLEVTLLDASDEATLTIVVEDDENGDEQNGDEQNGDEQNGDEQNGDEQNGDEQNGDDDGEPEDDDDQPGFGLLVALVSLLGAALLARRRNN